MSASGRKATGTKKLKSARGLQDLGVPKGFDAGVDARGRNKGLVEQAAADKSARLAAAVAKYEDALASLKESGTPDDKAIRIASKQLDGVADLVKQHAIEAKDGGDVTVLADMASALMTLDAPARQMVLRRAGNPEIFRSLDGAELASPPDEPPGGGYGAVWATAKVAAEERDAARATSRDRLPVIARPSSHFRQEGRVDSKGKVREPGQVYKDFLPRNDSPMDVDTSERRFVLETQGADALAEVPLTKQEERALKELAGDQIRQARKIEAKQRAAAGYSEDVWKTLAPEQQAQIDMQLGIGAYLPEVRPLSEKQREKLVMRGVKVRSGDETMTLGTDQSFDQGLGRGSSQWRAGGQTIDRVVDNRNRGDVDRLLAMMYELTQPVADIDPNTGVARVDHAGNPATTAPSSTWINLNKYFPEWRARLGQMREDGTLEYPANAMSPQFLTHLIHGLTNAQDPNFTARMLPLIERSVEKTPGGTGLTLTEGGDIQRTRAEGGKRSAAFFDQEQFVPSPSMAKEMKKGLGSPGYPFPIYGDRVLPREPMEPPSLTPTPQQGAPAPTGTPQISQETLDAIEAMRQRIRKQAEGGNTASIYTVPQDSPTRTLIS